MTEFIVLAADGGVVSDITKTFGVNWQLFISQLIAFIVVALVLKKFAYKPVLDMLDQRRERIAQAEANAEKFRPNWPRHRPSATRCWLKPTKRPRK